MAQQHDYDVHVQQKHHHRQGAGGTVSGVATAGEPGAFRGGSQDRGHARQHSTRNGPSKSRAWAWKPGRRRSPTTRKINSSPGGPSTTRGSTTKERSASPRPRTIWARKSRSRSRAAFPAARPPGGRQARRPLTRGLRRPDPAQLQAARGDRGSGHEPGTDGPAAAHHRRWRRKSPRPGMSAALFLTTLYLRGRTPGERDGGEP